MSLENSEGKDKKLKNLQPFRPNEIANPRGRPKQNETLAKWIREKTLDLGQDLFNLAKNAEKDSDKIKAIELLLAYGIGKPTQQIDISSTRPIIIAPGILEAPPYEPDA